MGRGGGPQLFGEMRKKTAIGHKNNYYPQFGENDQNCHIPPLLYYIPPIFLSSFPAMQFPPYFKAFHNNKDSALLFDPAHIQFLENVHKRGK